VFQNLALADDLDVPDNLFLGREKILFNLGPFSILDYRGMREATLAALEKTAVKIPNIRNTIRNMSGGQRQCVAIARTATFHSKLTIMDEPTAALGVQETAQVENIIRTLKAQGEPLILISHNMRQVFDLVDRIVVFRRGRIVANLTSDRDRSAGRRVLHHRRQDGRGVCRGRMMDAVHRDTAALVVGGTQGLGLAIAARLRAEGCTRLVIAGRDRAKGEAAAAAVGAVFLPVDLEDTEAVIRLVDQAAEAMGRVTALAVAGALTDRGSILDTTPDLWDRMMTANARSPFFAIQRVAQRAIEAGTRQRSSTSCRWSCIAGSRSSRPIRRRRRRSRTSRRTRRRRSAPPHPGERDQLRLDGHAGRGCDPAQVPRRGRRLAREGRGRAALRHPCEARACGASRRLHARSRLGRDDRLHRGFRPECRRGLPGVK
jgi:energy-coupling factor transporter ATP-binding protein EcfA2